MTGQEKESKDSVNHKTVDDDDGNIVFYYSREHRLSKASPLVLEHNRNTRPGLTKGVIGNRSNFMILAIMFLVSVIYVIGSRISSDPPNAEVSVGNNTVALSVFQEGSVFLLLIEKTASTQEEAYQGLVDIVISPVQKKGEKEPPSITQSVFFSDKTSETFSFSLPFDGSDIFVIFYTDDESIMRRVRKRR